MKFINKTKLLSSLPQILAMLFLAGFLTYAWTEPSQAPPGGNVEPPLNVSTTTQYKAGALGIGGVLRGYLDLIIDGKVGIGTTNPGAKLEVSGNIIAAAPTASGHVTTKGYVDAQTAERGYIECYLPAKGNVTSGGTVTCVSGYTKLFSSAGMGCQVPTYLPTGSDHIFLRGIGFFRAHTNSGGSCDGGSGSYSFECLAYIAEGGQRTYLAQALCRYGEGAYGGPPYTDYDSEVALCCK